MATKIEIEAWRDEALDVILSKQVVPLPPSTVKFIAAINPVDDLEAQAVWEIANKLLQQYESLNVTVTPVKGGKATDVKTLRHLYEELVLIE